MDSTPTLATRVAAPGSFWGFFQTVIGTPEIIDWAPDPSALELLIEQFVALGATKVVLDANSPLTFNCSRFLSDAFKRHVIIVDEDCSIRNALDMFVAPLQEEFGITRFYWGNGYNYERERQHSGQLEYSLNQFADGLHALAFGMKYQTEVQGNIGAFATATDEIRANCKHKLMRARLATIAGLLRTYEPVTFDAIRFVSMARDDQINSFEQLLAESEYEALSHEARWFGIPARSKRAAKEVARFARRVVAHHRFRGLLTLGSAGLSAATGASVAGSEIAEMIGVVTYIPPFTSFKEAIDKAYDAWCLNTKPVISWSDWLAANRKS